MKTLADRFIQCKGVGPGFDHMRIGLSLTILFWHSFAVANGSAWIFALPVWPFRPFLATLLPMFFALSGVLVMGSAIRLGSLRTFITFRVLRILPALFTEVSLSALVFGPLLTAVPLAVYFSSHEFFEYFGSFVGRVRVILPGLFLTNPIPRVVNSALWTVGPEIVCYLILALAILTKAYRDRTIMLVITILYTVLCIWSDAFHNPYIREVLPTHSLILAFLAGNLIYLYQEKLPFSATIALAVFAASVVAISVALTSSDMHILVYPAVYGLAYVTAIAGFSQLPPLPFFHRGDYSYGIYIYSCPIQQAIAHFFPEHRSPLFVFAVSLPITLLCAIGSWHYIEKPFLGLRKRLIPGQGQPEVKEGRQAYAVNWTLQKVGVAAALCIYTMFVVNASEVFPLRASLEAFLGRHSTEDSQPTGQHF